jgi:protein AATF/BFR2
MNEFVEDTIDKWYSRSLLASGNAILEKKFKAVNQSIMSQVNHVLKDASKLRKKSQLKRTPFTVLGKKVFVNILYS